MISAVWRSLKNGDYPIITLEWRRMMRRRSGPKALLISAIGISALGLLGVYADYAGRQSGSASLFGSSPALGDYAVALLLLVHAVVLSLAIPLYTARSIASQAEGGSLEMLMLTPMSSTMIVGQIAVVAMGLAVAVAVILFPALIALCLLDPVNGAGVFRLPASVGLVGPLSFLVTSALFAAIGLFCSCTRAGAQSATFMTYLLIVGMTYLLAAVWIVLCDPWRSTAASEAVVVVAAHAMPLAMAALFVWMAIGRFDRLRRGVWGGLAQ